ncbi:MAG: type II toxin-antitoxin system VapC family toxin, partial [Sphingobacteriaceae bacterium]
MADEIILLDTSILTDYYRKSDKANSVLFLLIQKEYQFAISVVTKYEIYAGAMANQLLFWDTLLQQFQIIPFNEIIVDKAVELNSSLKQKRKQIDLADLFIAASAVANNFSFATLNLKHFE